jgi:Do/DeqQ family serine protease
VGDPFLQQSLGRGEQVERALGSGVLVRPDGHILTNYHVIEGAEDIKVDLSNGRTYEARVIGSDPASDLAVLKIQGGDLPVLPMGDSDQARVGDVCLAVGNPLALGESVTAGIISAKGRTPDSSSGGFQQFLQIDAQISLGNSGGALVNTRGELIGINSRVLTSNGASVGIGLAIPSNMARKVMEQLITRGRVERGVLGVSVQTITGEVAAGLDLRGTRGVLVSGVNAGSAAEKAGLKPGDVIIQFDGKEIEDNNAFRNMVAVSPPGTEVTLTIVRDSIRQSVRVKLGELTSGNAGAAPGRSMGGRGAKLGVTVVGVTPEIAGQLGVSPGTQGVWVQAMDPAGPAAQAGIRQGDVIQWVNRHAVRTPEDLLSALTKVDGSAPVLLVNRAGQTVFVAVPLR